VLLTWSLLYFGIALYRSSVRAQALGHEARLEALRYQIQPHSSSCAHALSNADRRAAQRRGRAHGGALAGFLRVTLEGTAARFRCARRSSSPGAPELEGVRFGDRLRARFDVDLAGRRARSQPDPELRPQPNGEFVVVMHSGLEVRRAVGTPNGCGRHRKSL